MFIMGGIAAILYVQGKNSDAKSTLIAGFIVFFVAAASVIYNIKPWSFTKQSIVHFGVMLVTVYPILLFSGWFAVGSIGDAIKIFLIFALAGILLWSLFLALAKIFS
ncbi:DUF3021 domain-containing protein [Oceanobacillus jeddahense]|uniref:DUF3021 domain-containing protein n=1 Tax=Oceanobacillus jeddahense TaxID=1462527 RepID=UPI0021CC3278|nr:DUF3021 domain-containing protein [Oceanobacillus jeddahense]